MRVTIVVCDERENSCGNAVWCVRISEGRAIQWIFFLFTRDKECESHRDNVRVKE